MMRRITLSRMLRTSALVAVASLPGLALAQSLPAQQVQVTPRGTVITPGSSIARPEDTGIRMHTNIKFFVPRGQVHINAASPSGIYETPASLACLYGVTTKVAGCNPKTLKANATGGSKMIAIVDAYDDPKAASDLAVYSKQYGLPAPTKSNFEVVYAAGTKPGQDPSGGWEAEESLDVDVAHALAPNAKIVLVEAASESTVDLLGAVRVAATMVAQAGGGEVSSSWGGTDFSGEEAYQSSFSHAGVVFFASAGDAPGPLFPSVLPNVVGVGGTSVIRSPAGFFQNQTSWASTGGGPSSYIRIPSYQKVVSKIVGTKRGAPDVALVADPNTGDWIYDSIPYNGQTLSWQVVGGTSLASPATAAIVNAAGSFKNSSVAELTDIYAHLGKAADFSDIKGGSCSNGGETSAVKGWDFCTGVGTPIGKAGK